MSKKPGSRKNKAAMELFTIVCKNGGVMDLEQAVSALRRQNYEEINRHRGAAKFIETYFSKILKVQRDQTRTFVEAIIPLAFCQDAAKGSCPRGRQCTNLHLCPHNIKGTCKFKEKCRLSHNIRGEHTMSLLQAIELGEIDDSLWRELLQKILADTEIERGAASHAVPNICKFYNNEGGCTKNEKCPFLHVCRHFVDGDCKFGFECKRIHYLTRDSHNNEILKKFGMGNLPLQHLLTLLKRGERKRTSSSSSDSSLHSGDSLLSPHAKSHPKTPLMMAPTFPAIQPPTASVNHQGKEICGFHLKGKCNYGEKCLNLHRDLPYQWQYQEYSSNWLDFPEDSSIMAEDHYCSLSSTVKPFYISGKPYQVCFDEMVADPLMGQPKLKLRRVSTQSSEEAPPGHIFSTHWFWYWKDEHDDWLSYDSPGSGIEANTTCSKSLEKDYLQGKESHSFSAGRHSYILYYKKMFQRNVKFLTERGVMRRPEFVAKDKMKEIAQRRREALKEKLRNRSSSTSSLTSSSESSLPPHWSPMEEKGDFCLESLSVTSQEYNDAERKFQETMITPKTIVTIERIQNPDLWIAFVQKKGRMTSKASGTPPAERTQLFHGTTSDVRNAICQQGFDWRMCGKHGTLYGKGSYFACQASYSHRYTKQHDGSLRYMFVARVLVGAYALGNRDLTRPPPKDPSNPHGELFDSCVNDVVIPSIFVIFENSQAYPEYLITYK